MIFLGSKKEMNLQGDVEFVPKNFEIISRTGGGDNF